MENHPRFIKTISRRLLPILLLLIPLTNESAGVLAQSFVQRGVVKTRGRYVNGKLQAGKLIENATVSVKDGNSVVSNAGGNFSFDARARSFRISRVSKTNYSLLDADLLQKSHQVSGEPLYVLLETREQMRTDKTTAYEKLKKNLETQLAKKQKEIEKLKKEKKISDDRYYDLLDQLDTEQNREEVLLREMADRFCKMDFDVMSENERMICDLIQSGQLSKADSIINAKGSMEERVNSNLQHRQANDHKAAELQKSKAVEQADREDIAADCLHKYDIHLQQYNPDSAAYYLALRARLDSTRVEWQLQYAHFFILRHDYGKAETPLLRTLSCLRAQSADGNAALNAELSVVLNSLGQLRLAQKRYDEAERLFREAETRRKALSSESLAAEDDLSDPYLAQILNNLGVLCFQTDRLQEGRGFLQRAIDIQRHLCADQPDLFSQELAQSLNNQANVLVLLDETEESAKLYRESLQMYAQMIAYDAISLDADKAATKNNLAHCLYKGGELAESLAEMKEAAGIYARLVKQRPDVYTLYLDNLLRNHEEVVHAMAEQGVFDQEQLLLEEISLLDTLSAILSHPYSEKLANKCNTLGDYYDRDRQPEQGIKYYAKALDIYERLSSEDEKYSSYVARVEGNLSFNAILRKDFVQAEALARKGLQTDASKVFINANLAAALLFQKRFDEAQELYLRYRDRLRKDFLDDLQIYEAFGIIPAECTDDVLRIRNLLAQ